ncbi:MAG TPA: hypothetical protein VM487_25160 [Phycisphaerae bacterium]|nr:hypothetical protein [Phycisphaerae bacterium]
MSILTLLLQILVIFLRWWRDPNRLAAELEEKTEEAYETSLNEFRKRVAVRDGDGVAVMLARRLRELRDRDGGHPPE